MLGLRGSVASELLGLFSLDLSHSSSRRSVVSEIAIEGGHGDVQRVDILDLVDLDIFFGDDDVLLEGRQGGWLRRP